MKYIFSNLVLNELTVGFCCYETGQVLLKLKALTTFPETRKTYPDDGSCDLRILLVKRIAISIA